MYLQWAVYQRYTAHFILPCGQLRYQLLNGELFLHIDELRYIAVRWQMDYNHYRPHSSLDYMAPAAFAAKCLEQGSATLCLIQDKENSCEILS
jgi:transposase InsO family protein